MPLRAGLLVALVLVAGPAAGAPVEVAVESMAIDGVTGSPVIRLVEKTPATEQSARELPIWIGPFEAQAIALEMHGVPPPRPFTHDLMKRLVEQLGGRLARVEITELRESTYYASVHVVGPDGKDRVVDARPSDAIALALRLHGPILVAEELFAAAAATQQGVGAAARVWGLTVQDLTPELADFFDAGAAGGVVVSDVAHGASAHEVHRGDVITALDGQPVVSARELVVRAGSHPVAEPVRLSLQRSGRAVQVSFPAR